MPTRRFSAKAESASSFAGALVVENVFGFRIETVRGGVETGQVAGMKIGAATVAEVAAQHPFAEGRA
jgi:hypothetical protein